MTMFENCKKAEIYDDTGVRLCQAGVQLGPMGGLLLVTSEALDLQHYSTFQVVFYDPVLGLTTCKCALSSPLKLPDHLYSFRCEVLERLGQEQRRHDVKVPIRAEVMIQTSFQPGDAMRIPKSGHPASVVNISAGGVCLRTDLPLQEARRLWFDFDVGGETITLTAQILRVTDASPHPGKVLFDYGCRFVNLNPRHESQLRGFVFQEELRLRRNKQD